LSEKLTPISVEELPSNQFFFDKKRKVVVRQELYQEAGTVSKKFKILTNGRNMKKEEFAMQIAGTLGAFTTMNQYSIMTLKDQLKRKHHLIMTLEAKLATIEATAKDQASATLEKARIENQKEIKRLKVDLEQTQLKVQTSQTHIIQ
jgi:hypothetical protein